MAPKKLQSLLFPLKKLFFGTRLSSVADTTIFHLGSRNFVCTISIHNQLTILTAQKHFARKLENLTDQRLTEVTFGVTVNV